MVRTLPLPPPEGKEKKEGLPTWALLAEVPFAFATRHGFATLPLAHASDSLVRVSGCIPILSIKIKKIIIYYFFFGIKFLIWILLFPASHMTESFAFILWSHLLSYANVPNQSTQYSLPLICSTANRPKCVKHCWMLSCRVEGPCTMPNIASSRS